MVNYANHFFNPATGEVLGEHFEQGKRWWDEFPHVPNKDGRSAFSQALASVQPFMVGRTFLYRLHQSGEQTMVYCDIYNLDKTKVLTSIAVGIELYSLMTDPDNFTRNLTAELANLSEV